MSVWRGESFQSELSAELDPGVGDRVGSTGADDYCPLLCISSIDGPEIPQHLPTSLLYPYDAVVRVRAILLYLKCSLIFYMLI